MSLLFCLSLSHPVFSIIPSEFPSLELQEHLGKEQIPKSEVPGRIHKMEFRDFWLYELNPPAMIKDAIVNGYNIPLRAGRLASPVTLLTGGWL